MISVIIPCYNYGRYLTDCVHSLVGGMTSLGNMPGQTRNDYEVIMVNDASTDGTRQIATELSSKYSKIHFVNLEHNLGTAGAFNAGINASSGEYIMQLSADDMLEPFALNSFAQVQEAHKHSFVYGNQQLFANGRRLRMFFKNEQRWDFDANLIDNHIPGAMMYPRQAWVEMGGVPDMPNGREDWAMGLALGAWGYDGIYIHDSGYLYRREGQNRCVRNQDDNMRFALRITQLFPALYEGYRPMMIQR